MKKGLCLFLSLFYLLICSSHTFASGKESHVNLSAEPQQFSGILASHNQVRAKFNQRPLIWSNSLAQYAQQWVNHLAKTENCAMLHRPNYQGEYNSERFLQKYGENLFWASAEIRGDTQKLQHFSPMKVVKAWAEEESDYNYQTNTCKADQVCGHFTQMIWHESRQVGCAKAFCSDKSQIWACNYHPRGNYIGERPY